MRYLGALLVLFAGCTISERQFPKRMAYASCDAAFDCRPEEASESYENEEACREDLTRFFEDVYADVGDGCTYQADEATQCVRATRRLDCESWALDAADEDACAGVYTCDEESG